MAPPDKHILYLWGLYSPYELADGHSWDTLGPQVADHLLDTLAAYAPNVREAVIARLVEGRIDDVSISGDFTLMPAE